MLVENRINGYISERELPPKKKTELPNTYYKKPEEVHTFAQKYFKDINWETLSKEFNEMGQGK